MNWETTTSWGDYEVIYHIIKQEKNMGFHKRYIDSDSICSRYRNNGMQNVMEYLNGADAVICSDEWSSELLELLELPGDETNKWNQASMMISKKSLEMEKVSQKTMTNCH